MFRTLQDFFQNLAAPSSDGTPGGRGHALRLAAAVLLVEVMRAEPGIVADEREAVRSALGRRFALDEDEMASLIGLAEAEAGRASDFFHFTSRLNDQCSQPDKVALVEAMWQVAYADGLLDANENHVISKVAGLLHVTHGEYIAAKMRAKEAAGV
jgi:uncharacterized tellurite resistance protein B-like protein